MTIHLTQHAGKRAGQCWTHLQLTFMLCQGSRSWQLSYTSNVIVLCHHSICLCGAAAWFDVLLAKYHCLVLLAPARLKFWNIAWPYGLLKLVIANCNVYQAEFVKGRSIIRAAMGCCRYLTATGKGRSALDHVRLEKKTSTTCCNKCHEV